DDDGRIREQFNRGSIDTRYAAKLPIWQKTMILLWFSYCIKYLQTEDLLINGKVINLSVLFPEANSKHATSDVEEASSSGIGWYSLLLAIAKEGLFGDIDKADKKGIFDILLFLYDNHLKQQKLNRR